MPSSLEKNSDMQSVGLPLTITSAIDASSGMSEASLCLGCLRGEGSREEGRDKALVMIGVGSCTYTLHCQRWEVGLLKLTSLNADMAIEISLKGTGHYW